MTTRTDKLVAWATMACAALVLLGVEDPYLRHKLTNGWLSADPKSHAVIYKGLYDFGLAGLVSIAIYVLVVRIPDNQKRARLRKHLTDSYIYFKKKCLYTIVGINSAGTSVDVVDRLLDQGSFAVWAKRPSKAQGRDHWDYFLNNIEEFHLKELRRETRAFQKEVDFTLAAIDIPSDETFQLFKRLSDAAASAIEAEIGYDEIRPMERFLFEILSGFSWVTGYPDDDIVSKAISSI